MAALLLAGGGGTRLGGRPKLLLPVGGRPVVDWLRAVLEPRLPVWISAARETCYAALGLPVVTDLRPGGPLAGIEAGLRRAAPGAVLVVAGDMPFVSAQAVDWMLATDDGRGLVVDDGARQNPPLLGIWPGAVLPALSGRLDRAQRSVGEAVRALGLPRMRLPVACAGDCFNINTPRDLREAERRAARWSASAEGRGQE